MKRELTRAWSGWLDATRLRWIERGIVAIAVVAFLATLIRWPDRFSFTLGLVAVLAGCSLSLFGDEADAPLVQRSMCATFGRTTAMIRKKADRWVLTLCH